VIAFKLKEDWLIFTVRVVPRASRTEIIGEYDGALKVKLNSPPVDGEANKELIRLLAKTFAVSQNEIQIISGQTSKTKQVKVFGSGKEKVLENFNNK
jgi:uncharacterized protein